MTPSRDQSATQAAAPLASWVRATKQLLPASSDWRAARRHPGRNLMAGMTVAIVALPLALAFGVSSGLGAQAGLVTAVVAGLVAAVFGGSNLQVSGPTGAMTVVLVPVVHEFGHEGVLLAGLLAGILLIAAAYARLGRLVRHLPLPVIEGFTAGIAVVIALQQLPIALGVPSEGERVLASALRTVQEFAHHPSIAAPLVALSVATVMLLGARLRPGLPFSLIGVIAATAATTALGLPLATIGELPSGLPAPSWAFVDLGAVQALLPAALAIAALGALESLLSATVADGMAVDERHDPERELFGQGLANLASPLFGGMPATAAIARTAVNVRAGASSKLAAASHAVVLAAVAYLGTGLVAGVPLAALAGVLLATTVRMIDGATLHAMLRSTHRDAAVLVLTFVVTVSVDLITAVAVGVATATVLALREIAGGASLEETPIEHVDHSDEERALLRDRIVAFRPEGPLFFGAANRFLHDLTDVAQVDVVILRLGRVRSMDTTSAHLLVDGIHQLQRRGITVLCSGASEQQRALLFGAGLTDPASLHDSTPEAILAARAVVRKRSRALPHAAPA